MYLLTSHGVNSQILYKILQYNSNTQKKVCSVIVYTVCHLQLSEWTTVVLLIACPSICPKCNSGMGDTAKTNGPSYFIFLCEIMLNR